MQFTTTNISQIDMEVIYKIKLISKAYDTIFLGIYAVDITVLWRINTEKCAHK
jgi:hypothetical protein